MEIAYGGASQSTQALKMDQRKIDFAKRYSGVDSEQESIERARSLLMQERRIVAKLRALRGALRGDDRPEPRVRFLSAVVLLELRLGADTPRRRRAVGRIQAAFAADRILAPTPGLFDRAGQLYHLLFPNGRGGLDRPAPINDLLIALTARRVGATLVTSNLRDFQRISG